MPDDYEFSDLALELKREKEGLPPEKFLEIIINKRLITEAEGNSGLTQDIIKLNELKDNRLNCRLKRALKRYFETKQHFNLEELGRDHHGYDLEQIVREFLAKRR